MRISDWSSDVCSSDLRNAVVDIRAGRPPARGRRPSRRVRRRRTHRLAADGTCCPLTRLRPHFVAACIPRLGPPPVESVACGLRTIAQRRSAQAVCMPSTNPAEPSLLSVRDLSFARTETRVFGPLDFDVAAGQATRGEGDKGGGTETTHGTPDRRKK